jgi:hypothetical protein
VRVHFVNPHILYTPQTATILFLFCYTFVMSTEIPKYSIERQSQRILSEEQNKAELVEFASNRRESSYGIPSEPAVANEIREYYWRESDKLKSTGVNITRSAHENLLQTISEMINKGIDDQSIGVVTQHDTPVSSTYVHKVLEGHFGIDASTTVTGIKLS